MEGKLEEGSKEDFLVELPEPLTRKELFCLKGPLDIPMTNDYLFRALLQQNNQVLKALICALLHLDPQSVREVSVENPIELGKTYEEKELILDIKALLNGDMIINLEMQVVNEQNWKERSLYYLCRSFDHLNKGMNYSEVKPAVQIGILNFSLFEETPEFYANFYMINEKNYQKYSDKFRLAVVDLTQIKLATKEDRAYKIDQWAQFFKSKDWGELVMLAQDNIDIQAAMGTVYQLSREKQIRQQCEAREDYYKRERDRQRRDRQADEREKRADERERQADERERQADERDKQADERDKQADERDKQAAERDKQADERDKQADERERMLEEREHQIEQNRQELVEGQEKLEQMKQSLAEWEKKLREKELDAM